MEAAEAKTELSYPELTWLWAIAQEEKERISKHPERNASGADHSLLKMIAAHDIDILIERLHKMMLEAGQKDLPKDYYS